MYPEKSVAGTDFRKHHLFLRVFLQKFFLSIVLLLLIGSCLQAQTPAPSRRGSRIIDDTTRQIYGPTTSRYYYEDDVFYNRPVIHPIDTVIRNFHRWNYVQRNNNFYQDLGNIGTAIQPIFYRAPATVGVRSGFEVYDMYWDSEKIRYYDTKSPFSNMNVVLGGKGRSHTRATFSRNITPRWNFGLNYKGIFIDKQIPVRQGKGDRVSRGNYYDFYTALHTKDSVYRIFANFQRIFHRVFEPGGVNLIADSSFADYFDENLTVWLNAAESNDLRTNFHISHQIQAGKGFQVYHTFDRYKQLARFLDRKSIDTDFFKYHNIEEDTVKDTGKHKVVRNEFGIKGNLLKLFYNGYYAIRHYNMTYNNDWLQDSLRVQANGDENFIGGRMELRLDSIGLINGWVEANEEGQYRIEGKIVSRWFDGSFRQMVYKPSFAQQAYIGSHNTWNNTFADIESSQLNGNIHYRSKVLRVSPGFTFTRLKNYVFFDHYSDTDTAQRIAPVQSGGNQIYASPELKFALTFFRHVTLSSQVIYTRIIENADDAIRVPELFVNAQLAYENIHFNGNLDMHAGFEVHWHSAYFAPGYDPATRQFYNQDTFEVNAFPVLDVFLNAKVKRGRIFIKYNNLVQAFTKTGYFPTPYYPGQRNIIDFGFDWSFYD